jgi:uncharacterized protein
MALGSNVSGGLRYMMREVTSQPPSPVDTLPARWWADEMLGRLARYLRMVGLDTAYEPGLTDDELLRRSREEGRRLLTRDRDLARRCSGAIWISATRIDAQWVELRARFSNWPSAPTFQRCTLCNGALFEVRSDEAAAAGSGLPEDIRKSGRPVYRCARCRHQYWEGTHVESLRQRLALWTTERPP